MKKHVWGNLKVVQTVCYYICKVMFNFSDRLALEYNVRFWKQIKWLEFFI